MKLECFMKQNDFNALFILREVPFALVDIYVNNPINQPKIEHFSGSPFQIIYHAQRHCLHCDCCSGATNQQTNKPRGGSRSSSKLSTAGAKRMRLQTKKPRSPKLLRSSNVLPGVMNSKAACTVAAPKE